VRYAEGVIHNVTLLTSNPRENSTLQFRCVFRYIFSQIQIKLRDFVWYTNGLKLSPVEHGRLRIHIIRPDLTGTWTSILTFDPASAKDSGQSLYIICSSQSF